MRRYAKRTILKDINMFKLISEDLTNLGGRMGSEFTKTNYIKYFKSLVKAKKYAEEEYNEQIKWVPYTRNSITSGDLRYVIYTIKRVETED
jgi:hypothetical protein